MNALSTYLVEPRDPLIARDGRPSALGRFESLAFPYPSVLAGAARTRMASPRGTFEHPDPKRLLDIPVHGPLLAEISGEGDGVAELLAPAPLDALLYPAPVGEPAEGRPKKEEVILHRLRPRPLADGTAVDALAARGLAPIEADEGVRGKPHASPPRFWRWCEFERWLLASSGKSRLAVDNLGVVRFPEERRAHLAMQLGERVGEEGALFETAGHRFLLGPDRALPPRRFALALRAGVGKGGLALRREVAPLGGERRLARWRPDPQGWPDPPQGLFEEIAATGRARLVLLTPALFSGGALPGWNGGALPVAGCEEVTATVRGAVVPRAEVVSGWDLSADNGAGKKRGRPKPTRRLASAGSVYFLDLEGTPERRSTWCENVWLASVSDGPQDRRDGFGLAALGVWEGLS